MPPSLPAPSTANFLSESFSDMVSPLPTNEGLTPSSPEFSRCYPRSATVHVSRPTRSIPRPVRLRSGQDFRSEWQERLKPHFYASVRGAPERGETENFRVMFVRQVIDSAEDR